MSSFPLPDVAAAWRWGSLLPPIVAATYAPPAMVLQMAGWRSRDLIRHARSNSRFYARRFRHLAADAPLSEYPSVSRNELMAHFEDRVTDPAIRFDDVKTFIADPKRCGEPFLGRYAVWTSSGTTGVPGIYVSDHHALAVHEMLLTTRTAGSGGIGSLYHLMLSGGRLALIAAQDGHFAGIAAWERARRSTPWLETRCRAFPVTARTQDLVAALNDWQPALLASYPSMLSVMADELDAGRLRIQPSANTLLTNLGNHVQPLIRYQLGDSITVLDAPCECGCTLPRLRVEGRKDDVLKLPAAHGRTVSIVPLAIESVLEDRAGIHQFQLCQSGPRRLAIRFNPPAGLVIKTPGRGSDNACANFLIIRERAPPRSRSTPPRLSQTR